MVSSTFRPHFTFKNFKKQTPLMDRASIRHNEFVVNILEGAIFGEKAVGRPGLQCLEQVAGNTAADSCTAMERMACNTCRWKAAKQSKE